MDNNSPAKSLRDSITATLPQIALIGCGAIADTYYLPALAKQTGGLDNLILVDKDRTRVQTLATKFGVKRYFDDYRQILNQVNGAIIALPTQLHYPIAMEFLSRGIHVLCEKPLAESADKAREMVAESERTGAVLAAGYLQRIWPQFAKVKELLVNKTLGAPLHIDYRVGEIFDWPTVSGFYFNFGSSVGGVLADRGAHVIDHICWWLGGKPRLLSSMNDSFGGVESIAQVQLEYGKCICDVKLSRLGAFPCRFTIQCEEGTIGGDIYDFRTIVIKKGNGPEKRLEIKSGLNSKTDVGCKMAANFIDVVGNRGKPLIQGREVLDSMELIDECYRAAVRFDMPWYMFTEEKSG